VSLTLRTKVAVGRSRRDAHFAGVDKLDGIANQIEQHLRESLLITEAAW
jgi:hypothetical protein